MNGQIQERLEAAKRQLEEHAAPEELESRLRKALDGARPAAASRPQRARIKWGWSAAALLLLVMTVGNSYHAFAYYGKKLLGFDGLMSGTLQELNEQGMGQPVGAEVRLADGTVLTVEGLMSDANQLILYYRLRNDNGLKTEYGGDLFSPYRLKGFWTDSPRYRGVSELSHDRKEETGMFTFEPVSPFAKTLTLEYRVLQEDGTEKWQSLAFDYYPDRAMATQFKRSINRTVKVDQGTIRFRSITATPTVTVVKGTMDVSNSGKVNSPLEGVELLADGKPVNRQGSGTRSTFWGGYSFELSFDTLAEETQALELHVKSFAGYERLDLDVEPEAVLNETLELKDGRHVRLREVAVTEGELRVTLTTEEDVRLDGVAVKAADGGALTELKTTIAPTEEEDADGKLWKTRTLLFETDEMPGSLLIEGMHYMKGYGTKLSIPVK